MTYAPIAAPCAYASAPEDRPGRLLGFLGFPATSPPIAPPLVNKAGSADTDRILSRRGRWKVVLSDHGPDGARSDGKPCRRSKG